MKKLYMLILPLIILINITLPLHANILAGFKRFAAETAVSLWLKYHVRPAKFETPSGMLPLSEYHCIGTKYTLEDQINNLGQQLAAGVRCFEFDVAQEIRSHYYFFRRPAVVVGKNKREITSVLGEINSLLHTNQYKNEVVLIKLNNVTDIKLINKERLKEYSFTSDMATNSLPLLAELRKQDTRIVPLIGKENAHGVTPGLWNLKYDHPVTKNYQHNVLMEASQENIRQVNISNRAAVGCDYFPKTARSFFSPHFNMYHYVGMDYTNKNENHTQKDLERELAYGIRSFIFPLTSSKDSPLIGNTKLSLNDAFKIITRFAETYNEIITIHLTNVPQLFHRVEEIVRFYTSTIGFKPTDRLADIKTIPLYGQILKKYADTETGAGPKTIWPRLTWNYNNKKLIQVTYDGVLDTEHMWAASQYYYLKTYTLRDADTQLFYSDILKSEQKFALAATGTVAMALACLLITQNMTALGLYYQAIEAKAYELWGRLSVQAATAKLQGVRAEQDFTLALIGLALGGIIAAQTAVAISTGALTLLGIYALDKTKKTFTAVREGEIPLHSIKYVTSSVSELIADKFKKEQEKSASSAINALGANITIEPTLFDLASQHNLENFTAIDKLNMGWGLRIAHTIRKLSAPKK